jgi:alpha-mannosidase
MRLFADELARQAGETKGRNVMLTMGMDFFYSDAGRNYENLDLLIEAADRHFREDDGAIGVFGERFDGVNIFYSTPDRYTRCKYADAVNAAAAAVTTGKRDAASTGDRNHPPPIAAAKYDPTAWRTNVKTGDFFPYADCEHCYWSGYFSSRQGLKRQERAASSFLHAARQIESMMRLQSTWRTSDDGGDGGRRKVVIEGDENAMTDDDYAGETARFSRAEGTLDLAGDGASSWNASPLFALEDASGIAQHHDAVAGTSKQRKSASSFDTPILLNNCSPTDFSSSERI